MKHKHEAHVDTGFNLKYDSNWSVVLVSVSNTTHVGHQTCLQPEVSVLIIEAINDIRGSNG